MGISLVLDPGNGSLASGPYVDLDSKWDWGQDLYLDVVLSSSQDLDLALLPGPSITWTWTPWTTS